MSCFFIYTKDRKRHSMTEKLNTIKLKKVFMKYDYSILTNRQWNKLIDDWIFSERDRAIMKRRIISDKSYDEMAEMFELSKIQLVRIVNNHMDKLYRLIMVVEPME